MGAECPCGSGAAYVECCQPLHHGAEAATAEQLMRARYSAFVKDQPDYLFRSWHPRTRPADVGLDAHRVWLGLEILRTDLGGPDDDTGVVEFDAHHDSGVQHEVSRFERRRGRWVYVDADS